MIRDFHKPAVSKAQQKKKAVIFDACASSNFDTSETTKLSPKGGAAGIISTATSFHGGNHQYKTKRSSLFETTDFSRNRNRKVVSTVSQPVTPTTREGKT